MKPHLGKVIGGWLAWFVRSRDVTHECPSFQAACCLAAIDWHLIR
jgi:hypothetical protein